MKTFFRTFDTTSNEDNVNGFHINTEEGKGSIELFFVS